MSADDWAVCPRCLAEAKEASDKAAAEVYQQYGKVPVEEFDRLRDELPTVEPEHFLTFREDYEFYGAEEGEIHASYSGGCSKCGLRTDLKTSKRFWPQTNPKEQ